MRFMENSANCIPVENYHHLPLVKRKTFVELLHDGVSSSLETSSGSEKSSSCCIVGISKVFDKDPIKATNDGLRNDDD